MEQVHRNVENRVWHPAKNTDRRGTTARGVGRGGLPDRHGCRHKIRKEADQQANEAQHEKSERSEKRSELFALGKPANEHEARQRHLLPKHFSFNVEGGRCETCQGTGVEVISMQFLADVEVTCEECKGKRFRPEVLDVRYKWLNLAEVLDLTVTEALRFFAGTPKIVSRMKTLEEVGLGYLCLGQSTATLSGGEAQRLKLCGYLAEQNTKDVLYILDEPTTGLHFEDIGKLLKTFDRLIEAGASLLVIEHHLDVLKSADWIIDLGPEGGEKGGYLLAQGTPEEIAQDDPSHTGRHLGLHMARCRL
jgi:excinuclease ABC subunit A